MNENYIYIKFQHIKKSKIFFEVEPFDFVRASVKNKIANIFNALEQNFLIYHLL